MRDLSDLCLTLGNRWLNFQILTLHGKRARVDGKGDVLNIANTVDLRFANAINSFLKFVLLPMDKFCCINIGRCARLFPLQ